MKMGIAECGCHLHNVSKHGNGGGVYDRNRIIINNKITIYCSYRSNYYSNCLNYSFGYNFKQIK